MIFVVDWRWGGQSHHELEISPAVFLDGDAGLMIA